MKLTKLYLALLVFIVIITGCESLLDVDSDQRVLPDENRINSQNDSIYSLIGIFSQLEKLADRYVLLGELRGDLMDISEHADPFLKEIYNFNISQDNPYNNILDYYSVINNCNYLINNIDTASSVNGKKVMYEELAAAKAIRAWTYMQIAFNYGRVKYFEKPFLTVNDASNYVEYSIQDLLTVLIQDLEPLKNIKEPGGVSLGADLSTATSFFPIRFVLADLYLWNGQYEQAAIEYHDLIEENYYAVLDNFQSTWTVQGGDFVMREMKNQKWLNCFSSGRELITLIAGSTEYGEGADLDSLSLYYCEIVPSSVAINNWNKQFYYNTADAYKEGDLRGDYGSYLSPEMISSLISDEDTEFDIETEINTYNQILKFGLMTYSTSKAICVYRAGLLYLRYAEAVNRAGKPNLAFAVLKNGLSSESLAVDTIVPKYEKYSTYTDTTGTFYDYVDFEDSYFEGNIGIHARGCGNTDLAINYKIPQKNSLQDSILYVEDQIIEELALETAFEGNRFHDLMRISIRRSNPAYLANKVSEKYTDNKEAVRSKLMNQNNWYLP